jgi:hypothetical protein
MAEKEKYTKKINGEYMLDGNGNKIPLSFWINDPDEGMAEIVNAIPEAEIQKKIKELGLGEKMVDEEKFTKKINGEYMRDASGNKIPLSFWINDPDERMSELVNAIPEEEIEAEMKRLGLDKK